MAVLGVGGGGDLCQCNLKNNKSSEVSMNVHTAQDLTENSVSKAVDKCVCQREGAGLKRWGVMKLWPPQNERRLGGISVVPCNNRPLSHWQSLIIQYEEDSSLSPPLSLSSSDFCALQFRHAGLFFLFSLPLSVSLIPCELKAESVSALV